MTLFRKFFFKMPHDGLLLSTDNIYALLDFDKEAAFFGVFDDHRGRVVAKFCVKYLHSQVLKSEAYSAADLGNAVH